MRWVHQEQCWPEHFWNDDKLEPILNRIRHRVTIWSKERIKLDENRLTHGYDIERYLKLLFENAIITSEMEGAIMNSERLYESFKRNFYKSVKDRSYSPHRGDGKYQEDGLANMMLDAHLNCWEELTEARLCEWHRWLFPDRIDELGQEIVLGSWRVDDMFVGRAYAAPAPNRVPAEMEKFLDWFNDDRDTDSLIKAGRAHLWFEQIHPFDNGNGRIGRAVMDMLLGRVVDLLEKDVIFDIFHSMTRQIGQEIDGYYQGLVRHNESMQGQVALDITAWLIWFLECLERSMDYTSEVTRMHDRRLQMLLYIISNENFRINDRQKKVIRKMLDFEWDEYGNEITTAKYMEITGLEKSDTAVKDIRKLRDQGIFEIKDPNVGKKKTSYRLITWDEIREEDNLKKKKLKRRISMGLLKFSKKESKGAGYVGDKSSDEN